MARRHHYFICFLAVMFVAGVHPVHAQNSRNMLSNDGMYELCTHARDMQKDEEADVDPYKVGFCQGYLTGVAEALHLSREICLDRLDTSLVLRTYMAWVDRSPRELRDRSIDGLKASLKEAWPCEDGRQKTHPPAKATFKKMNGSNSGENAAPEKPSPAPEQE